MIIDLLFKKHVEYLDIESIKRSQDVIYILDNQMILQAYNPAWTEFAKNNNGEEILVNYSTGARIVDAFSGPLKNFIVGSFEKALHEGKPFEHDYECSSAGVYRLFHQTAYPLVESKGLVISNHLIKECAYPENEHAFREKFVGSTGHVVQCSNCRKIRDPKNEHLWFWVPSLVEKPFPRVSHGICPRCYDHYYPEIDD